METRHSIPYEVKMACVDMLNDGYDYRTIYDGYFKAVCDSPQTFESFRRSIKKWKVKKFANEKYLTSGTFDGFIAHDATVQVDRNGDVVQAWVKQKATAFDANEFIQAIKEIVKPYDFQTNIKESNGRMLEIPLFDMHWGVNTFEYYEPHLDEILELIQSKRWAKIVIPFGQDYFHNDSIVNGQTTKGTNIEKVDMVRAVQEGKTFIFSIVDEALKNANSVKVIYTPGNHDQSISWMFTQVLLERYGSEVVDASILFRKVVSYGDNAIMFTHGNSKRATAKNLAHIFPVCFPEEFSRTKIREVHCGHLHHEEEGDIFGVMVRRLSSATDTDEWSDKEDFVGAMKRFMLFEWDEKKLKSIHYI